MVEILKAFKNGQNPHPKTARQRQPGNIRARQTAVENQNDIAVSKSGWVSPRYRISKMVKINLRRAEKNRCVSLLSGAHETEYYKLLRTQIRQQLDGNGWNSVMITSAQAGEGKTVTAINLATMFAREYAKTVLLVDADLRNQSIHRYLGYKQEYGLAEHLYDNVPVEDIIVWPGIEKLTIISGGGTTFNDGAELLNSPRMHALVKEMKQRYTDRYIFFDVPPLLGCADALAFAPLVDAVLVVVEAGKTPMPEIQRAVSFLPQKKLLGLVMNHKS